MATRTLTGFIARQTEKAIGFIASDAARVDAKPLWLPRAKVAGIVELDEMSIAVQLKGESIQRQAIPVKVEADEEFLAKVGA